MLSNGAFKAKPYQPSIPVEFDNTGAFREGWGIFDCDGSENGPYQLQRVDEDEVFPSDDHAWTYVINKAREGSEYHKSALDFLRQYNPTEIASMAKIHGWMP